MDEPRAVSSAPFALVTGASGVIGPALVTKLLESGWSVRSFTRSEPRNLPPDIEVVRGDVTRPDEVRRAVRGVDVVFHAAALLHALDSAPDDSEYARVNAGGTRNVVLAAREAGVRRVVYFSSISVYGDTHGDAELDERTPPAPDTPYGVTKLEGERILLEVTGESNPPAGVVLRLAAVYGPHMKGNYISLARALRRGWFVPAGRGGNRRSLIYETDVAEAALLAAERDEAAGDVFNVSAPRPYPMREIIAAVCAALGRKPPRLYIPEPAAQAAAALSRAVGRRTGGPPLALAAALEKLLEHKAVCSDRIRDRLGFVAPTGLEEGWRWALAGLEGRGRS